MYRPELSFLKAKDGEPVFGEPWHAQTLALVEFRGRYAAVFDEHPFERGKHGAIVSLAIVGLGVQRLDLRPERLGPTRGRDRAAFHKKVGESERLRVPRLAKDRLAILGLEKVELRPIQDSSPKGRRRRGRCSL